MVLVHCCSDERGFEHSECCQNHQPDLCRRCGEISQLERHGVPENKEVEGGGWGGGWGGPGPGSCGRGKEGTGSQSHDSWGLESTYQSFNMSFIQSDPRHLHKGLCFHVMKQHRCFSQL